LGTKGKKSSEAGALAAAALLDDLGGLGHISSKRMFGGHGIFSEGVMFAIIDASGRCFLRGDDTTAGRFEVAGAERHGRMPYWEIPAGVRDDRSRLEEWATAALAIANAARK
jgi:DNA transformation protein